MSSLTQSLPQALKTFSWAVLRSMAVLVENWANVIFVVASVSAQTPSDPPVAALRVPQTTKARYLFCVRGQRSEGEGAMHGDGARLDDHEPGPLQPGPRAYDPS